MKEFNRTYHNLITPQEAVNFAHHYNNFANNDFSVISEILDTYSDSVTEKDKSDTVWYCYCLYMTIYNAGRIQGIRQERLRRNQHRERNQA